MGVAPEDIGEQDSVLAGAVDIEGQSVNRAKYNSDPAAVVSAERGEVAAAGVQPTNLPPLAAGPTGVEYFFHADDLPEEEKPAHAEIRVHRPGKGWNKNHKPNAASRTWLKELLARRLKIVHRVASPFQPVA